VSLAVEHFKTLCCLGLPPQNALMAIAAAVRDVIPAAWTRIALFNEQGNVTAGYAEHGDFPAVAVARYPHFMDNEPSSIAALMLPAWRAAGIGWTLHRQNADYLHSGYYDEIERPLDACWLLDAFVHDGTRSIVGLTLSRPRSANPFRSDDVVVLDSLRPWIAHAFRERVAAASQEQNGSLEQIAVSPLHKGTVIVDASGHVLFRTAGSAQLFMMLTGAMEQIERHHGVRDVEMPTAVQRVVRDLVTTATGGAAAPPRARVQTVWGMICLEAVWLAPPGATAADIVENRDTTQIAVNLELREHAILHAARVLRESGASPAQVRIGVLLATGKSKPEIAQELGVKPSSVVDATRKLYARLDVRNAAELGMRFWIEGREGAS
jgi:DNA-binding CsgD family transcriptional regulator